MKITTNTKEILKELTRKEKKHIPEATYWALKNTAKKVQTALEVQTEKKLDRPTRFTQKAFGIQWPKRNKLGLTTRIYIKDIQAEYLRWMIEGGTNTNKGKKIPVPTNNARVNKFGNIPGKKSGVVKNKQEIRKTKTGGGVWTKTKVPKLIIAFKDSITYAKDRYPFYKIGYSVVNNVYPKELTKSLRKEMQKK
tara:strand:+ start:1110 stop:1691 length:582 start_codon:yes stop_codon:yes gene_type:complete